MIENAAKKLAESVRQLIDAGLLDDVIKAIQEGNLNPNSGSASVSKITAGRTASHLPLKTLLATWAGQLSLQNDDNFVLQLTAIRETILLSDLDTPKTEVVWSGPKVEGSYLRATRQVVQDIIASAKAELLIVGYWLAGKEDSEGIINDIISQIANAVARDVMVNMVLDEGEKGYGKNNRETLVSLWPQEVPLPDLFTWRIPDDDHHLKLHAKVLVADQCDALVTSANLTMYALDRNMEMGVRIQGSECTKITQHFDLLKQDGTLTKYTS